jgi:4-amino-4-deoxy-L-arabinose transferase-like glycosyltransferase
MANTSTSSQLIIRFLITCAVLFAAQWVVPYYILAIGALLAGLFMAGTSTDKRDGYVFIAAAIFIAIIGWVSIKYWQSAG